VADNSIKISAANAASYEWVARPAKVGSTDDTSESFGGEFTYSNGTQLLGRKSNALDTLLGDGGTRRYGMSYNAEADTFINNGVDKGSGKESFCLYYNNGFTFAQSGQTENATLYVKQDSAPTEPTKTLENISITTPPTKTTYTVGESFDPAGMVVTATYSDSSSAIVTGYTVLPSGELATTNTSVTISYTEGATTKTAPQAITVNALETVASPVLPVSGNFTGSKSITITCETDGADIYYTMNGDTPTASSTPYTGAFTITSTTTVKSIAVKTGMSDSEVASATYTLTSSGGSGGSGGGGGTSPTTGGQSSPLPFTDVKPTDWFYKDIEYVFDKNIMQGTSATTFAPNVNTTRAMIATMLYLMEKEPVVSGTNPFEDVADGQWYTKAITWAQQNKIVEGYNETTFGPNDNITREQMATILYRYAKYKGYDVSVGEDTNILSYEDALEVSEYALPAMQWACGAGLINGTSESTLSPKTGAARAQVAVIIHRFCLNVK